MLLLLVSSGGGTLHPRWVGLRAHLLRPSHSVYQIGGAYASTCGYEALRL